MSPLISAKELTEILHLPNIKVFDVRGKWNGDPKDAKKDYNHSHIDGAIFLDWTTHFLEQNTPITLASVTDEKAADASFKTLGISKEDTVILYDDYHHMLAGRVGWAMRYLGFSNVKILNGGWKYWQSQNLPTSDQTPITTIGSFQSKKQFDLRISLPKLIETKDDITLIDGRGTKGYLGSKEDPRSGHIPGAINIPYSTLLDLDTGLFKVTDELHKTFQTAIPSYKNTQMVSSCGSGYAGTVILTALQILGIDAPLFDNSFSVWRLDNSLAVEQE